ncbi:MAG: hypothetical protein GWN00_32965, partial [Aliifodinibius sp.]|nr:hypothetical protein [Fodinibius sp.]NIV15574.1 hypothetical protein [Fodinibius sp.]NIY29428.1 hypothetical protein [Fodinibius sp.]
MLILEFAEVKRNLKSIGNRGKNLFHTNAFQEMVIKHNRFLPEFNQWRKLVAEHAPELAHLIKTFPRSEGLSEELLIKKFTASQLDENELSEKAIFDPWINRWSGVWSNGIYQYHIWDSTYFSEGQWIQPVSLSETGFADGDHLKQMSENCCADIGINVYSRNYGI